MPVGVVYRLEAVQIHKHQRKDRPFAIGFVDRLVKTVFEQHAVGQARQGIVQGKLGQLAVRFGQRLGKQ
ncbi:hypothetical protein D3C78_1712380 [compost metagenome]